MKKQDKVDTKDIRRYVEFFVPFVGILKEHQGAVKLSALPGLMADRLHLEPGEQQEKMANGSLKVHNRIAWVKKILETAGLLDKEEGNVVKLTDKGLKTKVGEDQDVYDVLSLAANELDRKKQGKDTRAVKAFLSYLAKYGFE